LLRLRLLALGSPPQYFKLQIDTGSADLLVYSVGCTGCSSQTTYNIKSSTTARRVLCNDPIYDCAASGCNVQYCDFDDQYGDGSHVSGFVVTDVFALGGSLHANISFGNIEDSSKNFEPSGVDGIWGLGWYTISDWNGTSAFQNVVNQLGLPDRFSMCLTASNPTLTLGGPSTNSGFTWTPVIQKGYYTVQFEDLLVSGTSLGIDEKVYNSKPGAIVDSGTTLFLIPTSAYSAMFTAFNKVCSKTSLPGVCGKSMSSSIFASGGASTCAKMTSSDIANFPTVTVQLQGAQALTISGGDYLIELSSGCYSMGIGSISGGTIIGDIFMQAFEVVFDRTNLQVGFGTLSNCPSVDRSKPFTVLAPRDA